MARHPLLPPVPEARAQRSWFETSPRERFGGISQSAINAFNEGLGFDLRDIRSGLRDRRASFRCKLLLANPED
jgi:hypothetical protein